MLLSTDLLIIGRQVIRVMILVLSKYMACKLCLCFDLLSGLVLFWCQVVCSMCRVANQVPWTGPGTQSFRCNRCGFLNYYDATIYGRRRPYDDDWVPMPLLCHIMWCSKKVPAILSTYSNDYKSRYLRERAKIAANASCIVQYFDYHPKTLRRNRFNRTIIFRHFSWKSGKMPRIINRPAAPQAAAAERHCRPMLPPCEKLSAMASAQTSALGLEGRC